MRKTMLGLAIVFLILVLGSRTANAQTSIGFGNGGSGSTGDVTFIANGGGTASLDLGSCSGIPDTCTLSGLNTSGGTYSFVTTESSDKDIQVGGFIGLTLNRGISMNGASTVFSFNNGSGGTLTGSVVWTNLTTDGVATIVGILTISTTTLSGPLGVVGGEAIISLHTNDYGGGGLNNDIFNGLSGTEEGQSMNAGGLTTPEPSSMLLLGSGLLMAGGIFRRKLRES